MFKNHVWVKDHSKCKTGQWILMRQYKKFIDMALDFSLQLIFKKLLLLVIFFFFFLVRHKKRIPMIIWKGYYKIKYKSIKEIKEYKILFLFSIDIFMWGWIFFLYFNQRPYCNRLNTKAGIRLLLSSIKSGMKEIC